MSHMIFLHSTDD